MRSHLRVSLLMTCGLAVSGVPAAAVGTEFTYQGQLQEAGVPQDGPCDFTFTLFDAATAGSPVGTPLIGTVTVTHGLFTVPLDFGAGVFTGPDRWLEIAVVCPAGGGAPTPLLPRQKLTATPYAQLSATVADGAVTSAKIADNGIAPADVGFNYAGSTSKGGPATGAPWSGLTGVPAGFADGIDNDTTYTAGSGLTLVGTQFGVNTAAIQARVTGTCAPGNAMRAIDASGNATCEAVPPGDITAVTAGTGLVGGGTAGAVTLALRVPLLMESYDAGVPTFTAYNTVEGTAIAGYANAPGENNFGVMGISEFGVGVDGRGGEGVQGTGYGGGIGVAGYTDTGTAVFAETDSDSGVGVRAYGGRAVWATAYNEGPAILAEANGGGIALEAEAESGHAVVARSNDEDAIVAQSSSGAAIDAASEDGYGIYAQSRNDVGIRARSLGDYSAIEASAWGNGEGMYAEALGTGAGVYGWSEYGNGVVAVSRSGVARNQAALRADNQNTDRGMAAYMTNVSNVATATFANAGTGAVLYLQNGDGGPFIRALNSTETDLKFRVDGKGNVNADGAYTSPAGDFAEMLPAVEGLEPGDLLAVNGDGKLVRTTDRYQSSVVGVYSTKPGFVGGRPVEGSAADRIPLAVAGIVPLKVTAENGGIRPGTLLVTSSRAGHAMRAQANPPAGTLVGKALGTLDGDVGMIDVLVTLQ